MKKLILSSLLVSSAVLLSACGPNTNSTANSPQYQLSNQEVTLNQDTNASPSAAPTKMETYDPKTITELKILDNQVGTGAAVAEGNTVEVNYTGWLPDGAVFDSSIPRGQTLSFPVGQGQVIEGWDKGLIGMKVGGKRRLLIPANMGYGAQGIPGAIPANSPLIFDVELISVK